MSTLSTPCAFSEGTLSDYTDGALAPVQAWRVRRHLARCPQCAVQVTALQQMNQAAQSLYVDVPVASMPVRCVRQIPFRPLLAGAAAVVAAGVWFAPEMPGRPRVAFADVENAMRRVKTAHWTETTMSYRRDGSPSFCTVTECWVRMNPPAIATHQHGYFPQETGSKRHSKIEWFTLLTETGGFTHSSDGVWYRSSDPRQRVRQVILQALFSPEAVTYSKVLDESPWVRTPVFGASSLIHFQRVSHKRTAFDARELSQEVWADSRTKRVSRRVVKFNWQNTMKTPKGRISLPKLPPIVTTAENFSYDEPLPKGPFALTPPPGAKVQIIRSRR